MPQVSSSSNNGNITVVKANFDPLEIDTTHLDFQTLNELIRAKIKLGHRSITLNNVSGQYYIGAGLKEEDLTININGVPGNDLAVFMGKSGAGPILILNGNGQDNIGNTMNGGKIVVKGRAGSVLGYGMRGGKLFIERSVGERVGIHMKGTDQCSPILVIGGRCRGFLGEYQAGGTIVLLGINKPEEVPIMSGGFLGTGIHGGCIYIRTNEIPSSMLGFAAEIAELGDHDHQKLQSILQEYCQDLNINYTSVIDHKFLKVVPKSSSPYGTSYINSKYQEP